MSLASSYEPHSSTSVPGTDPKITLQGLEHVLPAWEWRALKTWFTCFYPFQLEWLLDENRYSISVKARQIGASHTYGGWSVLRGAFFGETTTIVSKGERESREVLDKARKHAEFLQLVGSKRAQVVKKSSTEIEFLHGGRIIALPASSASRGYSGNVILDEFAYHADAEKVWDAASGAITHGHKIRIVSTPNGVGNTFEQMLSDPSQHAGYSVHKFPMARAIADGMKIDLDSCWRNARGNPRIFAQLYECSFLDADNQYIPTELIHSALVGTRPIVQGVCYAGLDIGKDVDRTSLVIVCKDPKGVHWVITIQQKKRTVQKDLDDLVGLAFSDTFRCAKLCVDSTGMGAFPAEELARKWGKHRVEPVKFTQNSKEEMASTLYENFARSTIKIPQEQKDLIKDIMTLRRIITPAGNVRYDAPHTSSGHADSAWALALALIGCSAPINRRFEV